MKYKVIKSAAHNFGDFVVSLMNYRGDDYVISDLARLVVKTGHPELTLDLMTGRAQPRAFLWGPIRVSIAEHVRWFPDLLASDSIDRSAMTAGTMRLVFRPEQRTVNAARWPSGIYPSSVWSLCGTIAASLTRDGSTTLGSSTVRLYLHAGGERSTGGIQNSAPECFCLGGFCAAVSGRGHREQTSPQTWRTFHGAAATATSGCSARPLSAAS
jgi:hypothetical protein